MFKDVLEYSPIGKLEFKIRQLGNKIILGHIFQVKKGNKILI